LPQVINSYDQNKVPNSKDHLSVKAIYDNKHSQLRVTQAISQIKGYWSLLSMKGDIKTVCGDN